MPGGFRRPQAWQPACAVPCRVTGCCSAPRLAAWKHQNTYRDHVLLCQQECCVKRKRWLRCFAWLELHSGRGRTAHCNHCSRPHTERLCLQADSNPVEVPWQTSHRLGWWSPLHRRQRQSQACCRGFGFPGRAANQSVFSPVTAAVIAGLRPVSLGHSLFRLMCPLCEPPSV